MYYVIIFKAFYFDVRAEGNPCFLPRIFRFLSDISSNVAGIKLSGNLKLKKSKYTAILKAYQLQNLCLQKQKKFL